MTAFEAMSGIFPALAISTTLRATALLAGAALIARLVTRSGARARHALWSVTLLALLALPALGPLLPRVPVVLPAWAGTSGGVGERASPRDGWVGVTRSPSASPAAGDARAGTEPTRTAPSLGTGERVPWLPPGSLALVLWLAGALPVAGALALGLARARRVALAATPPADSSWEAALDEARRRVGVRRRVAVGFTRGVSTPMTGGVMRPFVLLPERARSWSPERREMVLLHELVHVARADVLRHAASRLAAGIYWFHPLVWWAVRRAALAREEACDAAVVALGHRPSSYARHLLELAEPAWLPLPALSRLERPQLEKRLMAVLDPSAGRSRRWLGATTTLCAILWALSVAAVSPRVAGPERDTPSSPQPPAAGTFLPVAITPGAAPAEPDPSLPQESACLAGDLHGDFDGTWSQDRDDRGRESIEASGTLDRDRIVQTHVDGALVCVRARGPVGFDDDMTHVSSMADGAILQLEVRDEHGTQSLEMSGTGDGIRTRWVVDGKQRAFDEQGEAWRDAVLAVAGARWQVGRIRGQVSTLRGEISSVRGEESSLRGEISAIRGHVSELRGEISSVRGEANGMSGRVSEIRGEESSLRGEISGIRGRESTLRGEISEVNAHLSELRAARGATDDATTRERLATEIAGVESRLTELQAELEGYGADGRVAAVEKRLAEYDADGKAQAVREQERAYDADRRTRAIDEELATYDERARVRAVEERLAALDVAGRVGEIERRIDGLDADRRVRAIQERLEVAGRRLLEVVRSVR